jgi:hypothetical protein
VVLSVALLAGCAPTTEGDWTRAGASEQQREQDKLACLTEATRPGPGGTRDYDAARYTRCMTGRGYQRAPAAAK